MTEVKAMAVEGHHACAAVVSLLAQGSQEVSNTAPADLSTSTHEDLCKVK